MSDPNAKITFSYSSTEIDVDYPKYGYESTVTMSIANVKREDGTYSYFDRTSSYDSRMCKLSFMLTETESETFIPFWKGNVYDYGRTNTITMALDSSSGFFPFGPDKGDTGNFTVKMLDYSYSYDHYTKFYTHEITLVMVTAPAYVLPTEINQGAVIIGDVDGLLMCQDRYGITQDWNFIKSQNNDGSVKTIDGPVVSDDYETAYIQLCNQSKAAALIDYLVGNRDSDIYVIAPNCKMFGYQSLDRYVVNLIGENEKNIDIRIIHKDYDKFDVYIKLYLKEVSSSSSASSESSISSSSLSSTSSSSSESSTSSSSISSTSSESSESSMSSESIP